MDRNLLQSFFRAFTSHLGKTNHVMLSCVDKPTRNVVYFQGDIQDLRGSMEEKFEDISRWKEWSLEDTHAILKKKFPDSIIMLIRPSNVLRDTFCCFRNFVQSSIVGTPEYSSDYGAIPHLYTLLDDCFNFISESNEDISKAHLHSLPTVLVGFSKGCVVLNQMVHELGQYIDSRTSNDNPSIRDHGLEAPGLDSVNEALASQRTVEMKEIVEFLNRISDIYWLDGGHSGEEGVWITDYALLSALVKLNVHVHVHVSPLQIACPQRPWIGEEEKVFVSTLKDLGCNVDRIVHFDSEPGSLVNHFRVLNKF